MAEIKKFYNNLEKLHMQLLHMYAQLLSKEILHMYAQMLQTRLHHAISSQIQQYLLMLTVPSPHSHHGLRTMLQTT